MSNNKSLFSPMTFLVWLLIIASTMLFLAFGSAYLVHKSDSVANKTWDFFTVPYQFWVSTAIVIVSSISMQLAFRAAAKDDVYKVPSLLTITLLLGIAFSVSQVLGWRHLTSEGHYFAGSNVSYSFLYVISGAHLAHILGGLILLIVGVVKASRLEIHKKNLGFIQICKTYWHFLGIVWIFLILFLYFA